MTAPFRVRLDFLARAMCALGACAIAAAAAAASAQQERALTGRWATQGFGSIVELRPCPRARDTMCGWIVWLWQEHDAHGAPRTDAHNPDRAARARPLVGIEIVRGLRETEPGVFAEGELYNPDDGRTYTGEIRVRGGTLELRGCALRVFCQTQTWRRPEEVIAAVRSIGR